MALLDLHRITVMVGALIVAVIFLLKGNHFMMYWPMYVFAVVWVFVGVVVMFAAVKSRI